MPTRTRRADGGSGSAWRWPARKNPDVNTKQRTNKTKLIACHPSVLLNPVALKKSCGDSTPPKGPQTPHTRQKTNKDRNLKGQNYSQRQLSAKKPPGSYQKPTLKQTEPIRKNKHFVREKFWQVILGGGAHGPPRVPGESCWGPEHRAKRSSPHSGNRPKHARPKQRKKQSINPRNITTIGDELITYYILKRSYPVKKRGYITVINSHIAEREKM